jgi:predicted MPP superfamily phosphohydrolase
MEGKGTTSRAGPPLAIKESESTKVHFWSTTRAARDDPHRYKQAGFTADLEPARRRACEDASPICPVNASDGDPNIRYRAAPSDVSILDPRQLCRGELIYRFLEIECVDKSVASDQLLRIVPRVLTRRQFITGIGAGFVAANFGYARWFEPRWLNVTRHDVPITGRSAEPPLRVLHISDPHLSSVVPLRFIEESLRRGLAEKPDLIAITGDFVTGQLHSIDDYVRVLSLASSAAPTFACLGNHDGGVWSEIHASVKSPERVLALLRRANVRCLVNASHELELRGRPVQLIGVGDLWSEMCDPTAAFAATPKRDRSIRLVLNHNPDAKTLLQPFDWDVMLSGHTHSGQIRIPLVGTPFAPVTDKRYVAGLYRWDHRWLHVSCGVGNLHGVRYGCRPEISLLTLV